MGVLKRSRSVCFSLMPVRNGVFEFPAIAMVDTCVVVVITLSFFYIKF